MLVLKKCDERINDDISDDISDERCVLLCCPIPTPPSHRACF